MVVKLVPLEKSNREKFILDNQWAFKHGAMIEFGNRDDHLDDDGEIISRKTIEKSIDDKDNNTYQIMVEDKMVGGVIDKINKLTNHNHLEILYVLPQEHSKGIVFLAWKELEKMYPETKVWETCTPYFEKRNIHFYVNKCGFQIDQFWCEYFHPGYDQVEEDEGPDEMFRFIKVMK